jgi:adenylosuccinate synthase
MSNSKKKMFAVIGANFGDEGKGLMVDYLASKNPNPLVIRFNGGAQAGHTVQTPEDGIRHVFSHFGSGSLVNAPTYLSKHFICNPLLFRREHDELILKCDKLHIFIDKRCIVTTPFDTIYNQLMELSRNDNRHGSVGVGINATLKRTYRTITVNDLVTLPIKKLVIKLIDIFKYYNNIIPEPKSDLEYEIHNAFLNYMGIIESFISDCSFFVKNANLKLPNFDDYDTFIFEGAQGLLLDEEYGIMPYCSPTSCGMKNVEKIINEFDLHNLPMEIIYMTRWYMTRHGAGPLANEEPLPDWIVDLTNKTNDFQQHLRYAPLKERSLVLINRIFKDAARYSESLSHKPYVSIGMTCLDQHPEGMQIPETHTAMATYLSYGPTRETIQEKTND